MVSIKVMFGLLATVLFLGVVGCQKTAPDRIESAQKQLNEAAQKQADRYAPSEYAAAQETLRRARDELDRKNNDGSAQLAMEAEKQAQVAIQTAENNKKEMRDYIKNAIEESRKVIDQTKEEYENAKKLNVSEKDLSAAKDALVSGETDLKQADDILNSGDIVTAREKVKAVQNRLLDAQQRVRNLVAVKAAPYKRK